jgi:hypothetical protein
MRASVRLSLIAFVLVQQLPSPALAQASQLFSAGNGTIFPGQKALTLIHTCSRGNLEGVQGAWTPTSSQIVGLEKDLPEAFRIARKAWAQMVRAGKTNLKPDDVDRTPASFFRQYGGLLIGGRKVIYVNAFRAPPWGLNDWRSKAVDICDGGANFFGVGYDVERKDFGPFAFNGTG